MHTPRARPPASWLRSGWGKFLFEWSMLSPSDPKTFEVSSRVPAAGCKHEASTSLPPCSAQSSTPQHGHMALRTQSQRATALAGCGALSPVQLFPPRPARLPPTWLAPRLQPGGMGINQVTREVYVLDYANDW